VRTPPVVVVTGVVERPSFDQPYGNHDGDSATPLQSIRRFCWDCMGGHPEIELEDGQKLKAYRPYGEVRGCTSTKCWLHPYRTGRRPKKDG